MRTPEAEPNITATMHCSECGLSYSVIVPEEKPSRELLRETEHKHLIDHHGDEGGALLEDESEKFVVYNTATGKKIIFRWSFLRVHG